VLWQVPEVLVRLEVVWGVVEAAVRSVGCSHPKHSLEVGRRENWARMDSGGQSHKVNDGRVGACSLPGRLLCSMSKKETLPQFCLHPFKKFPQNIIRIHVETMSLNPNLSDASTGF